MEFATAFDLMTIFRWIAFFIKTYTKLLDIGNDQDYSQEYRLIRFTEISRPLLCLRP